VDDGGCKLAGYVVEKREFGHQQWEMATPETVWDFYGKYIFFNYFTLLQTPLTEFTVPGLREFHDVSCPPFPPFPHTRLNANSKMPTFCSMNSG
jgi:hypothetical protein